MSPVFRSSARVCLRSVSLVKSLLGGVSLAALGVLLSSHMAVAQTTFWTGAVSSDWRDANNWSNGLPGSANFDAGSADGFSPVVDGGAPVTLDNLNLSSTPGFTLTIQNGGQLAIPGATTHQYVGQSGPTTGAIAIVGEGSELFVAGDMIAFGFFGRGDLTLTDGGTLRTGDGDRVLLGFLAGSTGVLNIGAAEGETAAAPGFLDTSLLEFGGGSQTLVFNHTSDDYLFDPQLVVGPTPPESRRILQENGTTRWASLSGSAMNAEVEVRGGTFIVDSHLSGNYWVYDGAILGGNGRIGSTEVLSGGTITAGNSIGNLTVNGDLDLLAGAIYLVEVNDAGADPGVNNDLLTVDGQATIDSGAIVRVRAENGADDGTTYVPGTTYTILTANEITGTFNETVDHDFAFLDAELDYDAHTVFLILTRNEVEFDDVAATPNQRGAAAALGQFDSAVTDEIAGLSASGARAAYDSASGEVHASGQHVVSNSFAMFGNALGSGGSASGSNANRAVAPLGYSASPTMTVAGLEAIAGAEATYEVAHSAWLMPLGGQGFVDGDGNAARLDWGAGGVALGYEGRTTLWGGDAAFGLGVGHIIARSEVADRTSTFDTRSGHIGAYGDWSDGALSLSGHLAYGAGHVSTSREISIGAITETATAQYWAHGIELGLEAGYGFVLDEGLTVSPLGTLAVGWTGHEAAMESGAGAFNAAIDSQSSAHLDIGLGAELAHTSALANGGELTVRGRALWEHAFGDVDPERTVTLAGGGDAFTVSGPQADRDRLVLGAGLTYETGDAASVSLDYTGRFSGNQTSHAISAGLKAAF